MFGTIQVSTAALRRNAEALRALVTPAKTTFVVKSNAYGHGLVETALAVEPQSTYLGVYGVEEALELRDGGITAPILILGPVPPKDLPDALAAKCEIALWDVGAYVAQVVGAARKRHLRAPVHVKINTGVNRFGLDPHDALDAIDMYLQHRDLAVAGIFSHLAAAEEFDSPFTMLQLERFAKIVSRSAPSFEDLGTKPLEHIAASAAAMLWAQTRLDMVRIGIALYGLWPSEQTREAMNGAGLELVPALSYLTKLVATRSVAAGSPVGYGCSYHATHDMRLGVVPLGYADGIPRALSNTGAFVVDGVRCPIVGRVAMNATMIDITTAVAAHTGSRVTLIGHDGAASVTADDWARWDDTINYEIVARLPVHIPRTHE
jgi:alanine racemase